MKMTFEFITPEEAADLLKTVPEYQRAQNRRRISALARDMMSGNYIPTHQAIAISDRGTLDDGQHRCAACVLAGVGFWTWVCRGVPTSSYGAIDVGKTRTISEANVVAKDVAAIGRQLLRTSEGTDLYPSYSEIERICGDYSHAISVVLRDMDRRIANAIEPNAAVRAAVVRATFYMTTEAYDRMIHLLYEGQVDSLEPGDGSILRLREYILNRYRNRSQGAEHRFIVYAKTEAALRAYIDGRDIIKLYAPASEVFPLPGEDDEIATGGEAA